MDRKRTKEEILAIFNIVEEYDVESDGKNHRFESYFPTGIFKSVEQ